MWWHTHGKTNVVLVRLREREGATKTNEEVRDWKRMEDCVCRRWTYWIELVFVFWIKLIELAERNWSTNLVLFCILCIYCICYAVVICTGRNWVLYVSELIWDQQRRPKNGHPLRLPTYAEYAIVFCCLLILCFVLTFLLRTWLHMCMCLYAFVCINRLNDRCNMRNFLFGFQLIFISYMHESPLNTSESNEEEKMHEVD